MKITKFGHSCLLVEEQGARFMFDPGVFSTGQNQIKNIDAILITHDHQDHVDYGSLKKILDNNPGAALFTNEQVGAKLEEQGIAYFKLEHKESTLVKGVSVEGYGLEHAVIHSSIPVIKNVGYFIAGRLFYPGDALTVPDRQVEILALPLAAPWMKISETIDYSQIIKPKIAFPVHDAIVTSGGPYHRIVEGKIKEFGTRWVVLELGQTQEF